jgi:SAM-dependent methyltransferase
MHDDWNSYEEKKARELNWYSPSSRYHNGLSRKILRHPLLYSLDRVLFSYVFPKQQMALVARRTVSGNAGLLLNAPCGRGNDFKYVERLANQIHGLDLSPVAVSACPQDMKVTLGDVLSLPYPNAQFDLVVSPLFFHHLVDLGFVPFLSEFRRVLKPGASIIILEPSQWYPLNIVTRPLKKLFGNPYDEVDEERPFPPRLMLDSLRRSGFVNIEYQAATFSHPSFFRPIARFVNRSSSAFLRTWPLKNIGWLLIYTAMRKSENRLMD